MLEVERRLNLPETKREHPEIGSDIKVMGVRRGARITLTIGCAFIGRYVASIEDCVRKKDAARALASEAAAGVTAGDVDATINAADDLAAGDVFLTVTGTSAEAGDDGEVGRGNRANGLITPYRLMTMEAAAGKNPVSHVGNSTACLPAESRRRSSRRFPQFGVPLAFWSARSAIPSTIRRSPMFASPWAGRAVSKTFERR